MKTNRINLMTLIAFIAMISFSATSVMAQKPERGQGYGMDHDKNFRPKSERGFHHNSGRSMVEKIPGLTEEQKTNIQSLRITHLRKSELIKAELGEKQARMRTLRLAEKQDEKAIDKTIDEISKLRGDLMKEREAHQREVKKLLTDEQKAWYDANCGQGYGHGWNKSGMKPGKSGHPRHGGRNWSN